MKRNVLFSAVFSAAAVLFSAQLFAEEELKGNLLEQVPEEKVNVGVRINVNEGLKVSEEQLKAIDAVSAKNIVESLNVMSNALFKIAADPEAIGVDVSFMKGLLKADMYFFQYTLDQPIVIEAIITGNSGEVVAVEVDPNDDDEVGLYDGGSAVATTSSDSTCITSSYSVVARFETVQEAEKIFNGYETLCATINARTGDNSARTIVNEDNTRSIFFAKEQVKRISKPGEPPVFSYPVPAWYKDYWKVNVEIYDMTLYQNCIVFSHVLQPKLATFFAKQAKPLTKNGHDYQCVVNLAKLYQENKADILKSLDPSQRMIFDLFKLETLQSLNIYGESGVTNDKITSKFASVLDFNAKPSQAILAGLSNFKPFAPPAFFNADENFVCMLPCNLAAIRTFALNCGVNEFKEAYDMLNAQLNALNLSVDSIINDIEGGIYASVGIETIADVYKMSESAFAYTEYPEEIDIGKLMPLFVLDVVDNPQTIKEGLAMALQGVWEKKPYGEELVIQQQPTPFPMSWILTQGYLVIGSTTRLEPFIKSEFKAVPEKQQLTSRLSKDDLKCSMIVYYNALAKEKIPTYLKAYLERLELSWGNAYAEATAALEDESNSFIPSNILTEIKTALPSVNTFVQSYLQLMRVSGKMPANCIGRAFFKGNSFIFELNTEAPVNK